jgi:hypothetical protein
MMNAYKRKKYKAEKTPMENAKSATKRNYYNGNNSAGKSTPHPPQKRTSFRPHSKLVIEQEISLKKIIGVNSVQNVS